MSYLLMTIILTDKIDNDIEWWQRDKPKTEFI